MAGLREKKRARIVAFRAGNVLPTAVHLRMVLNYNWTLPIVDIVNIVSAANNAAASRRRFWSRFALAGPMVFVCATLVMCGGALWLPKGTAQIDNLVVPIVLFPAIWAALFFYAYLDRSLARAWAVIGVLSLLHAAVIGIYVVQTMQAAKAAGAGGA
jgi:hypothetical protein